MQKKTELSNGVRVVTRKFSGRNSLAIGFWVGVGGRYELGRLKGAAHFLEHIVFKGSQKYDGEEIKMNIEGIGGALNAFTSEEQTCFYAKIPSKHLNQTFDVLSDMVINPKINAADVRKEKTVIIEEIKMYSDLPQYQVSELLDQLIWPDHPLGRSLAGTKETVGGISNGDLKKFHKSHYTPENIVVSACGDVNHDKIVGLVKRKLGSMKPLKRESYIPSNDNQSAPRVKLFKKNIEQMHLALGMPAYDEYHKDRYGLTILSIILGGNMSSRLFVEVREKRGLAYSISCNYKTLHDTGVFLIRAGVDNKKITDTLDLICKELSKIKRNGVSQNEFKRAREYLSGQLMLGLEDSMDHMLWIGEGVLAKNKVKTLNAVLKELKKIKPSDIKRIAKDILDNRRYNLAVVGPLTAAQESQIQARFSV